MSLPDIDELAAGVTGPGVDELHAALEAEREANDRLRRLLGLVESVGKPTVPRWQPTKRRKGKQRSTAFTLFSDQHLDEIVRPDELNGVNAYGRDIALGRLRRWAEGVIRLAERDQAAGTDFEGLIIFSLGDTLTGWIHEELQAGGTEAAPTASLVWWAPKIAAAYRMLADHFGSALVVNEVGNHGRTTKRQWSKQRVETNYDWVLAEMVAMCLADDDRFEHVTTLSPETVTTVYDTTILSFHGNAGVSGGNGISGLWPPLMRAAYKMKSRWGAQGVGIDCIVLGHWHQYTPALRHGFLINGTLKGVDEWTTQTLNAPPTQAEQTFGVIHPDHGIVDVSPVFVVDRKDEGW